MMLFYMLFASLFFSAHSLWATTDIALWCKHLERSIVEEIEQFHTPSSEQQTRDCAFLVKITQFNVPLTITQPGIYCVGENLTINAQAGFAVSIQSDNVILDLNDNQVIGAGSGTSGVIINGKNNIIIRNGSIRNMSLRGIGINIQGNLSSQNVLIEQMELINDNVGLTMVNTRNWAILNSVAFQNQSNGFLLTANSSGSISGCASNNNNNGFSGSLNNGITFSNCTANFNVTNGFNAAGLRNSHFEECTAFNNQNNGFLFLNSGNQVCDSCSLRNCTLEQNANIGLQLTGNNHDVQDCTAKNNVHGFEIHGNNHIILNNIAQSNSTTGFLLAGSSNGFPASTNCQVRNNTATANKTGFNNLGTNNRIYTNFANNNTTNFNNITNVIASPAAVLAINFTANIAE